MPIRRSNSQMSLPAQNAGRFQTNIISKVYADVNTILVPTGTVATSVYQDSNPISCPTISEVTLLIRVTAAATGDIVSLIPMVRCHDDSSVQAYYPLAVVATATNVTLGSAPSAGVVGATFAPTTQNWYSRNVEPAEFKTTAATNSSTIITLALPLTLPRCCNSFMVQFRSDAGNPLVEIYAAMGT